MRLRRLGMVLLLVAAAPAQQTNPLRALADNAAAASIAWENAAKTLETRIARMLPCDPHLAAAIEEVAGASQTRLAAQARYFDAAVVAARQDLATARAALQAEQNAARDVDTERAEADQERIAVEGQLGDLTESVKRRATLEDARASLQAIAGTIRARAGDVQLQATRRAALVAALSDIVSARGARERALEAQLAALTLETARWRDYYGARLVRARTECEITNPSAARRKQR